MFTDCFTLILAILSIALAALGFVLAGFGLLINRGRTARQALCGIAMILNLGQWVMILHFQYWPRFLLLF